MIQMKMESLLETKQRKLCEEEIKLCRAKTKLIELKIKILKEEEEIEEDRIL